MVLAVSNANYEFTYIDIGTDGRKSDSNVWADSKLKQVFESGCAHVPDPCDLPNCAQKLPYVLVAGDAFPLTNYLLKPHPHKNQSNQQRIFSYRLSRARRVVENAFGILSTKFRVLYKPINVHPKKVQKIVLACVILHNMLLRETGDEYIEPGILDEENLATGTISEGLWRQDMQLLELKRVPRRPSDEVKDNRDNFMQYFNHEGVVPWQRLMCGI